MQKVDILILGERLKKFKREIKRVTIETLKKINNFVKVPECAFVFLDLHYRCIKGFGFGGETFTKNFVLIYLNPLFPKFKEQTIKKEIPITVAHEFVHVLRRGKYDYDNNPETLLDSIISEGLANNFSEEICGQNKNLTPWAYALSQKKIKFYLHKAKKYFKSKDYNLRMAWLMGDKKLKIPKWTGYSLGFYLVKEYLKLTNKKPHEILKIESKEIIKKLKI
jgi:uncharacterized protein YjaZ